MHKERKNCLGEQIPLRTEWKRSKRRTDEPLDSVRLKCGRKKPGKLVD